MSHLNSVFRVYLPVFALTLWLSGCASTGSVPQPAGPSEETVALLTEAEQLVAEGDLAGALARIEGAGDSDMDVVALRAQLLAENGDRAGAVEQWKVAVERAVERQDLDSAAFFNEVILELASALPDAEAEALARAAAVEPGSAELELEWRDTLDAALMLLDEMDVDEALAYGEAALDLAEGTFGAQHLHTIETLRQLAEISFAQGDFAGAESWLAVSVERSAEALGDGHPETVALQSLQADLYEAADQMDDALFLREVNVDLLAETIGPGHPETVFARERLALIFRDQGDFERAEQAFSESCGAFEAGLGRFHPNALTCYTSLGRLYNGDGVRNLAGETWSRVLDLQRASLGEAAPEVLLLRAELAEIERLEARYGIAREELETVLKVAERHHPDDVDLLAQVRGTLARVLDDQGEFAASLKLKRQVYDDSVAVHGPVSPESLFALSALGDVYRRLGEFGEAQAAYSGALDGYIEIVGRGHPSTIPLLNNLGVAYEEAGLYDEAEPLLREALNAAEDVLGEAHPTTLNNMNNLALLHESQGNFDLAEPLYRVPIQILSEDLGPEHPQTVAIINNLAYLKLLQQDYAGAGAEFERAYGAWNASLGTDHQYTLKALNNLGRSRAGEGRLDEAEEAINEALKRRRRAFGGRHVDVQRSMHDLGALYIDQGDSGEAVKLLRETLKLNESELGEQHPYTFETLNSLARALEAAGDVEAAIETRELTFVRRTAFLDRMLWATSENAREGYVRLHRPELDAYLNATLGMDDEQGGEALVSVGLHRKGILLRVSAEIQQIASLGLDAELNELADRLVAMREQVARMTLAGPQGVTGDVHLSQIRELESEVELIEGELSRASARYRETSKPVGMDDLVAAMPDNSVLVDFLVFDVDGVSTLTAGLLVKDGEASFHRVVYDDYESIRDLISEYRELIQDESALDDDILYMGMDVHDAVWAQIAEHIADGAKVFFVPDGSLNVLPFEALANEDEEYIIRNTELVQLSSSRDLLPSTIPAATGPIVIVAGPDFDTEEAAGTEVLAAARSRAARRSASVAQPEEELAEDIVEDTAPAGTRGSRSVRAAALRNLSMEDIDSRSGIAKASLRAASEGLRGLRFSPLPGAEDEGGLVVDMVNAEGRPNVIYARGDAEEQILNGLEAPPQVLHVATHGFFLKANDTLRKRLLSMQRGAEVTVPPPGDNPLLRAGLAFAGINSNAPFLGEIDTRNDGVLTALEVLGLDLEGTQLAVLSACETGLGEIHDGEGVYGLRRAFEEAGVRQIILSLWEVSDAGTQALMTEVYSNLLQGMEPRTALRSAQRTLMDDPQWGYPYIWAAFTIVGN